MNSDTWIELKALSVRVALLELDALRTRGIADANGATADAKPPADAMRWVRVETDGTGVQLVIEGPFGCAVYRYAGEDLNIGLGVAQTWMELCK